MLVASVAAALLVGIPAASAASTQVVRLAPSQDVSLPFSCEWGYDWDERCYRDDGDRLPVGGDEDKLWRAALRFATSAIPPEATVRQATLRLRHDARCLGPRKTTRACEVRTYALEARPIADVDWFHEREVDMGAVVAENEIGSADHAQWVTFDVTGLVTEWLTGATTNAGILVKLADDHEAFGVGGPSFPSSSFARRASGPVLEVTYTVPG
jgi:hypothetical protein